VDAPGALFEVDGDVAVASSLTQGPWHADAQHGGPASALLAWTAERVPTLVPMRVARMTFDLLRPVPVGRLHVEAQVRREGKRIQLVESRIVHDGVEVAAARVLRVRVGDQSELAGGPPPALHVPAPPPPPSDGVAPWAQAGGVGDAVRARYVPGFIKALEIARVTPTAMWFRLRVPVVAGEATSPAVLVAAIADFVSGSSSYLDSTTWSAVNADVSVQLLRDPVGGWIAVDARSWYSGDATGHSRADLFDLDGFVATATASTLVERVRAPFA
jgi:hypothetical protein